MLCDFFLYSFAFTICPRVLFLFLYFGFFLVVFFTTGYNWWISLLVCLLFPFFITS